MIGGPTFALTAAGVLALGASLALSLSRRRAQGGDEPASEDGAHVLDVMSHGVRSVSSQSTVEEVATGLPSPGPLTVFAVTDRRGRAVGVLRWDDVLRVPHIERPALLVADLTRHAIVPGSADPSGILVATALADGGTAVVTDHDRAPVGLMSRDALPGLGTGETDAIR